MLTLFLTLFVCPQVPEVPERQNGAPPPGIATVEPQDDTDLRAELDAYLDARWGAPADATEKMAAAIREAGLTTPPEWQGLLNARRASYPDPTALIGEVTWHSSECAHVDYASEYALYVPEDYDPELAYSLVVVGHGGNSSMSAERAHATAEQYLNLYAPEVTANMQAIVAAPASERGWGPTGYSLVFSTISNVQRQLPIDPDRIYVTGQSMGGHLAYRIGLLFGDRFGAVSPHSGGYDFVEKDSIANLVNVPGLAVFGSAEPYGINGDNHTNSKWSEKHHLDWAFEEMNGGHTIYQEALGPMAEFFSDRPRNAYPPEVFLRQGGSMLFESTWNVEGWPDHVVASEERPLRWNRRHWLEVEARPEHAEPIAVHAVLSGRNRIDLTSDNLRRARLFVHPDMLDVTAEIDVRCNGKTVFKGLVEPDLEGALERARADDDRGRFYWATIEIETERDRKVSLPKRRAE